MDVLLARVVHWAVCSTLRERAPSVIAHPAHVRYGPNGDTLDLDSPPSYLLANLEGIWRIFAFVSPDELALAREHGLIG
jgi:hypothetical protein